MTKEELIQGIASGDSRALSKAITLAESTLPEKRNLALEVISHFGPQNNTYRIGITGTPGSGKSTFIEAIGTLLLEDPDRTIAVLSIDPSSGKTHGSILGDKTRMNKLSAHSRAYIRPTSSGSQLGGLAKNTRLAMLLCEAAGYNTILIESVGVGQGETEVAQLTDLFTLVLNPGGGDELQGIKRGIMEMADIIVINKADGDAERQANLTAKEYSMALHLMPENGNKWIPKVITSSALQDKGIDTFWEKAFDFEKRIPSGDWKATRRKEQMHYWARKSVQDLLLAKLDNYEEAIMKGLATGKLPEEIAKDLVK
ncbi:methylmalonyl Co-A mutase-associated GTPase MeaB [Bacteroidia bacterium]|jgi:LAO/AO transport system kinase|nr:methylmalonyl Co-A mutase-associated GTPase MeaB [Bacteroidia bacterium]